MYILVFVFSFIRVKFCKFSTVFQKFGELVFSAENISLKKTGKKSFLVSNDGQYRDDSKALISDSPTGYGDRSQKGRHLIRSVSLKELNSGKIHKEGHHLKDRHYTTNTQNTHDFLKIVGVLGVGCIMPIFKMMAFFMDFSRV